MVSRGDALPLRVFSPGARASTLRTVEKGKLVQGHALLTQPAAHLPLRCLCRASPSKPSSLPLPRLTFLPPSKGSGLWLAIGTEQISGQPTPVRGILVKEDPS